MYMMYEHNMCARCVAQEEIMTHTRSLSLAKEMLKNCYAFSFTQSLSLYICIYVYIYIYTRKRTHRIWQCGLRLIASEETLVPSPCYSTQRSAAGRPDLYTD